jgi:hypothetical protein
MFSMLKPSDMKKIHPPPVKLDPQQHLEQKAKMIWCLKLAFRCSSTLICTRIHTVICSFPSCSWNRSWGEFCRSLTNARCQHELHKFLQYSSSCGFCIQSSACLPGHLSWPPGLLSRWVLDSLIVTPSSDFIIMMINDESQRSCHALSQFFYHKLWDPSLVPFLFFP